MTLKKIVTLLVTISLLQVYSQNDEKILFTVDEAPVYSVPKAGFDAKFKPKQK